MRLILIAILAILSLIQAANAELGPSLILQGNADLYNESLEQNQRIQEQNNLLCEQLEIQRQQETIQQQQLLLHQQEFDQRYYQPYKPPVYDQMPFNAQQSIQPYVNGRYHGN